MLRAALIPRHTPDPALGAEIKVSRPVGRVLCSISESGYGSCLRGHGQSLDPHWSPLAIDHTMYQTIDLLGVNEWQEGQ
jgi:hypothetical protein